MPAPLSTFAASSPAIPAEPGPRATEPGQTTPELSGDQADGTGDRRDAAGDIDDRWVRALGIPMFGLGIPRVTDLLESVPIDSAAYWLGTIAFVVLAAAIWHGNRWLLFEQRRHWGWFDHPVRKVMMLLAAVVLFSVPISLTTLVAWYAARGLPVELATTRTVVLMIVICVVFVTHVYETVFLI
jgi:hypothetical protein